jgi:hypothetical protein
MKDSTLPVDEKVNESGNTSCFFLSKKELINNTTQLSRILMHVERVSGMMLILLGKVVEWRLFFYVSF